MKLSSGGTDKMCVIQPAVVIYKGPPNKIAGFVNATLSIYSNLTCRFKCVAAVPIGAEVTSYSCLHCAALTANYRRIPGPTKPMKTIPTTVPTTHLPGLKGSLSPVHDSWFVCFCTTKNAEQMHKHPMNTQCERTPNDVS